jgi:hypothetical protein
MSDLGRRLSLPAVQSVHWLDTTVLPPGDPQPWRAAVVIDVPESPSGTVAVVVRSGVDGFGVDHPADERLGLSAPGRFSRRLPVPGVLWTGSHAVPAGRLDDATFAAVCERFVL